MILRCLRLEQLNTFKRPMIAAEKNFYQSRHDLT